MVIIPLASGPLNLHMAIMGRREGDATRRTSQANQRCLSLLRSADLPVKPWWIGYVLAVVLCLTTVAVRYAIGFKTVDSPMLVMYIIPVIVSSSVGGLGAGLFCTFFSGAAASFFLLEPVFSLRIDDPGSMFNLVALMGTGVAVSAIVDSLHRMRGRILAERRKYKVVADNTCSWEFWLGPDGRSLYQSPASLEVTGFESSMFEDDPQLLERIVHPEDLGRFKTFWDGEREHAPGSIEFRIVHTGGAVRWVRQVCRPVYDADESFLGVRGSNSDITEIRHYQDAMIQAERIMSMGELAAGMAHEINNPLGGILQGVQNIKRRISNDLQVNVEIAGKHGCTLECIRNYLEDRRVLEFLESIHDAGAKAADIVRQILCFSRDSSLEKKETDIGMMLDEAVTLCSSTLAGDERYDFAKIRIVHEYDPSVSKVECESALIVQAVHNILVNSVQELQVSGKPVDNPSITLRTRRCGNEVLLEIEDNGRGIEPELMKRVFDPFFTTKPPGIGTGLGLPASYYIMARHGGSMEVESPPGKGACFIMRFPAGERAAGGMA